MATFALESRPPLLSLPATPLGVAVEVEVEVVPLGRLLVGVLVCVTTTKLVTVPLPVTETVVSSEVVEDGGGVVLDGGGVVESGVVVVCSGVVEEEEEDWEDDEVEDGGSAVLEGGDSVLDGGGCVVVSGGGGGVEVDDGGGSGVSEVDVFCGGLGVEDVVSGGGGGGVVWDAGGSGVDEGRPGDVGVSEGPASLVCAGGEPRGGAVVPLDMATAAMRVAEDWD
jgi:hypothetical protein